MGTTFQKYETTGRPTQIIWFLCFAAAGTAFALYILTTLLGSRTPPGEVIGFVALWLITAVWLDIQMARSIAKAMAAAGSQVYLFDSGFVHINGIKRSRAFFWNEISVQKILGEDDRPSDARYTLKRPDGAVVELDNTFWDRDDVGELGAEVSRRATTAQIPQVLAEVSNGRTVRFGRLAVNRRGLRDRRRQVVPWDQVESVQTFWDEVIVRTHLRFRKRVHHPISTVPNASVLATVAETLIREANHR
jgi:hypothetical protein